MVHRHRQECHIIPNVEAISKWVTLKHSQAYVIRFLNNFRRKFMGHKLELGPLKKVEVEYAEMTIIKAIQFSAYKEEILALKYKDVIRNSSIKSYLPFLDNNGIMRARGRIAATTYATFDQVHPLILSRLHKVTHLILKYYHERYYHLNAETAINEVRQRFIVPKLRITMKKIISNCQKCKNHHSVP